MDFLYYTNKPKISYAASFGVSEIPDKLKKEYIDGLNSIDHISVRESAGKDIVEKLTEKEATVVLDPTLLLTKEEWKELINDRQEYTEKYVLTYFLDQPNKLNSQYIKDYAKQKGYIIKNLVDIHDKELWVADPSEFVNLFSQAEAIFTDSFHACVFSIIFEKYFEVFERNTELPSMNSRIDTLFSDLGLEDRWHRKRMNEMINYEIVKSKLAVRKQESLTFLANSIENVKKDLKK